MEPGTLVMARYRVQTLVGRGGMGLVYRAIDTDGRPVAVKCVRADRQSSARRFRREIELLAGLEHPAIVRCLDTSLNISGNISGSDTGEYILVMEWLEGEDLAQRLRRGRLSVVEALTLAVRMAGALGHAHARGITHRDVKPGNIFLPAGRIEEAKLLDFGAARSSAATTLTATGAIVGTPSYMAPEQVRGEREVGPSADVFALGCVLYECLTGQSAFAGNQMMAVFYKILMDEPPRVSEFVRGVAPEIEALIASMLHKDRHQRPVSGAEFITRLEYLQARADIEHMLTNPHEHVGLTRAEQRMVSAIVVAGKVRLEDWLDSRTLAADENPATAAVLPGQRHGPTNALEQTLAEHSPVELVFKRFQDIGARFDELGDGSILAVFDGRGAATDRADDALRCALALRAEYPGQDIAVATGRAQPAQPAQLAQPGGDRVLGEAIERAIGLIAERGQGPAGVIRLDTTTADLSSARFSLERDGRGVILLGEAREPEESRLLGRITPFVGRRRELATLTAALDDCLDERVAHAVLVTGQAGAGKSRLRREFGRHVANMNERVTIWRGRGDAMRAGSALAAIAEMIRGLADIYEDEPLDIRRDKLRVAVARTVAAEDAERVTVFLGEIISTRWSDDDHVQLAAARRDAQLMSDQLRRAFEDLVDAQTRGRALIIEIDDLHWSDRATVAVLDHVLRRLNERSLLVLGYGRDEVQTTFPELWRERGATHLRLRPLSERAAAHLLEVVLGDKVTRAARLPLIERAQGNPLFLEELMRCAAAGRTVSDTVLAMMEARLQALTPEVRRVLRAASVFGDRFWRGGLEALLGHEGGRDGQGMEDTRDAQGAGDAGYTGYTGYTGDTEDTEDTEDTIMRGLAVLVREELATPRASSKFADQAEYSLRHDLVREAAYQMLTDDDRRLGHRLAGEWLQAVGEADALVLAEHYERAGDITRAIPFLVRAAETALEANDLEEATNLAQRGVDHGAEGEVLGALYAVQAGAHVWRGQFEEAIICGERALPLLADGSRTWYEVAEHMVHAQTCVGRSAPLEVLAERLVRDGLPPEHDADGWSILGANTATGLILFGHSKPASILLSMIEHEVQTRADVASLMLGHVHAVRAVWRMVVEGNPGAGLREYRSAVSCFEEAGNLRIACVSQINASGADSCLGLYAQAEATLMSALARAEQLSIPSLVDNARANLGLVMLRLQRPDEAFSCLNTALHSFMACGEQRLTCACHIYLAMAHLEVGALEPAETEARAALDSSAHLPGFNAWALAMLARILMARARFDQAKNAADEAMDLLAELGSVEEGEAVIRLAFAEALQACGEHERARLAIEDARAHLLARAARIDDPAWRRSFLDNVPENARTLEWAADRADAGDRPLHS